MTGIFFNLFVNSIFSLIAGLVVVGGCLWLFRIQANSWKLFFLSLPFVKVVYDALRGIPADSVLYSGVNPFELPPNHQLLQIGAGASLFGPSFKISFRVRDLQGNEYSSSLGDYLLIWIEHHLGQNIPAILVSLVVAISLTLVFSRILRNFLFEKHRRQERRIATPVKTMKWGWREIDVYVSKIHSGTPFTGGILRPFICIPEDAYKILDKEELSAVIKHEIGHIRRLDVLITSLVQTIGDIFWFIPGYHWLSRRIDRLREIVADQWAVNMGANPLMLASALIKLKEIPPPLNQVTLYSAFFRQRSLLKTRIEILLGDVEAAPPRFGWQNRWIRGLVTFWIFSAVMMATLGGNHRSFGLPGWVTGLLQIMEGL